MIGIRFLTVILAALSKTHGEQQVDEDIANLEEQQPARLMKKGGIVPPSPDLEEPIVVDKLDHDEHPGRIQKNLGPITRKITARGPSSLYFLGKDEPGFDIDFSLIAWKFADGTIKGHMLGELGTGAFQVDLDCLTVDGNAAVLGGVVSTVVGGFEDAQNTRAYVRVVDNGVPDEISRVTAGWSDETNCESQGFQSFLSDESSDNEECQVAVCSKRDGNWDECTAASFKVIA
mmetsp:Transcript_19126/g.26318  ORF Transcript_19126/g.26318 Transcript_19126/m.26318 type:complete len:232 (-) Transcript_19126:362-1057(-)|eukprot:CAMPEP_0185733778 /NCGR_PEP_ID=MMETSP1171-20130828/20479_1 /TAXON_ID=374046 /ORGANISM="Helicotheca tamensis, Strain CCMP826" /LENGTH=231 /DNA_ID=CAMNT_0028403587 /DNA_START=79 /DNA_END=774 /DNA_ORIENTATION=+